MNLEKNISTENWKPFKGWGNRKDHIVFLIRFNKEIRKKIHEYQKKLLPFNCFIPFPENYFHITIKPWGFLNKNKENTDDLTQDEINKICKKIQINLKPFEIKLEGADIFCDVVYLKIKDNGMLKKINQILIQNDEIPESWRDGNNFIAHCPLGTFRNKNVGPLSSFIKKHQLPIGKIKINQFELVIARWDKTAFPLFLPLKVFSLKKESIISNKVRKSR